MKKALLLLTILLLITDEAIAAEISLDNLQRGFWHNKTYLSDLLKSKSPQKASSNIVEAGFWVKRENNKYTAWVLYNFHDSGTAFIITEIKKTSTTDVYDLLTVPDQYANIKEQSLTLIRKSSGDEIQWKFTSKDNKKHDLFFVRIEPNLDAYVNSILLVGEYKDENNRVYKFEENGTAIWPERTFKYKVSLDFEMIDNSEREKVCDSIYNIEKEGRKVRSVNVWGFVVQKDGLLIYEPNRNVICGKKILYSLKRTK